MESNDMNEEVTFIPAELKQFTWQDFFKFDKMLFPIVARIIFMICCAIIVMGCGLGILFGLYTMFSISFVIGLVHCFGAIIAMPILLLVTRLQFEFVLVIFSINEVAQDIRAKK